MSKVYLEIVGPDDRGTKALELDGTSFIVGRSKRCAVRVKSDVTSREHTVIELREGTWFVRDLDSRNGTYLNGHRVQTAAIRPGDRIVFGESGPKVKILTLDPDGQFGPGGEDQTRYIRLSPRDLEPGAKPHAARPPEGNPTLADKLGGPPPRPTSPSRGQTPPPPQPQRPPQPPPQQQRRPPAQQYAPQMGEVAPRRGFRFPWLALIGAVLGAAVVSSLQHPQYAIKGFPYAEVLAPIAWIMRGLGELVPTYVGKYAQWIFLGTAAIYYGLVGLALQRPIRRIFWILAIAAVHVLAVLA